jgi:hypothetical protein
MRYAGALINTADNQGRFFDEPPLLDHSEPADQIILSPTPLFSNLYHRHLGITFDLAMFMADHLRPKR